jgi:hypothetical protein
MKPEDKELITIINKEKELSINWLLQPENKKYRYALLRCKARCLIVPTKILKSSMYGTEVYFRLTELGIAINHLIKENQ